MGFRGEMHDRIEPLVDQQTPDQVGVTDIAMHKSKRRMSGYGLEVRLVSRIRQRIEYDDAIARVPLRPVVNEIGTDKACAAGNE
jgi:hypothetical protein